MDAAWRPTKQSSTFEYLRLPMSSQSNKKERGKTARRSQSHPMLKEILPPAKKKSPKKPYTANSYGLKTRPVSAAIQSQDDVVGFLRLLEKARATVAKSIHRFG